VIRLALRVRRAEAELVLADLLEIAPDGVEEIESAGVDGGEDFVEYAVYGAPGELPALPDLQAVAGGALVEISTSEVPDDWSERWKRFHRPVLITGSFTDREGSFTERGDSPAVVFGGSGAPGADMPIIGDGVDVCAEADLRARAAPSLFVRPPWEAPSTMPGSLDVVIDPAQAFGTGAHATTRLCLELLLELAADGERGGVLDVGAGSGVLGIAAIKLGYGPVLALDNDRESVAAIADNAARNAVELEVCRFDLRREALPKVNGAPAPIVLANLLRPLLLDLAETMPALPPALDLPPTQAAPARFDLIAGGLLCDQTDEVAEAFAKRLGLRERARRQRGEWAALWLTSAR
jgi:ribosomal protein L11 methyltransferase